MGPSGSIARVNGNGSVSRVVTGLPSVANEQDATGPSDIAFTGNSKFAVSIGLGAPPSFRDDLGSAGAWLGHVLTGDLRTGALQSAGDLVAQEESNNPDGTDLDSNPVGLARWGNTYVVADAGANAVVRTNGTTVTALPPVPAFGPAAPFPGFPADAVPTDVVRGPDGAWYVSQLVGYPFEKGASSIWRVVPGSMPTKWATGLTNVTSLAFAGDGSLYAVEIAENGLLNGPIGRLAKVTRGGSTHATVAAGLFAPYGVAVRGSNAFVTTGSVLPGGGQVVRIALGG
ncbi:ScyD/ScyE family protein [Knoellia sp. CPCC 206450]|uniref:ScyD/ScyE family protein n=1 Tax=Knoellia tibetensis TaxID=3404798 RepID=UPI003B43A1DD